MARPKAPTSSQAELAKMRGMTDMESRSSLVENMEGSMDQYGMSRTV